MFLSQKSVAFWEMFFSVSFKMIMWFFFTFILLSLSFWLVFKVLRMTVLDNLISKEIQNNTVTFELLEELGYELEEFPMQTESKHT